MYNMCTTGDLNRYCKVHNYNDFIEYNSSIQPQEGNVFMVIIFYAGHVHGEDS